MSRKHKGQKYLSNEFAAANEAASKQLEPQASKTDTAKKASDGTYFEGPSNDYLWKRCDTNYGKGKYDLSDWKGWHTCSHPPQKVLIGEGFEVYAGKHIDCLPFIHEFPLILNCTGKSIRRKHKIPLRALKKWETYSKAREILLDWEDYEALELPFDFWRELLAAVKDNGGKLLVFCVGGHGRTGTAIAALLIAMGWKAEDARQWVWKNYCENAIENRKQELYLDELQRQRDAAVESAKAKLN
jgi:hypothetical protein